MIFGGLWRNADFRRLWGSQTLSGLGTNMVAVAIPLLAAANLGASAFEIGVISATEFLPYIFMSLFVGAWLDRSAKRPVVVLADLVRAGALLVIPFTWWVGSLTVPLLVVIVFVVGMCSVVSDIGCAAMLPGLVRCEDLIEGNSKLEISRSAANIGGMTVGGVVIQALSISVVAFVGVTTSLLAALATFRITRGEKGSGPGGQSILKEMSGGIRFVLGNASVRTLAVASVLINFFVFVIEPAFLLFITRTVALPPALIGVVMAMAGVGSLAGALLAERASRLLPLGRLLIAVTTAIGLNALLVPMALLTTTPGTVAILLFTQFAYGALLIVANVNVVSYRAAITPHELQGRMNAAVRMLAMSGIPVGSLVGGALGSLIGTAWTLTAGAGGLLIVPLVILLSPVARVHGIADTVPATSP